MDRDLSKLEFIKQQATRIIQTPLQESSFVITLSGWLLAGAERMLRGAEGTFHGPDLSAELWAVGSGLLGPASGVRTIAPSLIGRGILTETNQNLLGRVGRGFPR